MSHKAPQLPPVGVKRPPASPPPPPKKPIPPSIVIVREGDLKPRQRIVTTDRKYIEAGERLMEVKYQESELMSLCKQNFNDGHDCGYREGKFRGVLLGVIGTSLLIAVFSMFQ